MKAYTHILTFFLVLLMTLPPLLTVGCQKKEEAKEAQQLISYENLQTAYGLALKRVLWYDRYAKQAAKERLTSLAALFRAVSRSEQIHANIYAGLLKSKAIEPTAPQIDSVAPGKASQYLKTAVQNESVQVDMYPNLILAAKSEKFDQAVQQFEWAQKGNERHFELFKGIFDRGGKVPRVDYLVCSVCGQVLTAEKIIEECPVCKAKRDKFEKI